MSVHGASLNFMNVIYEGKDDVFDNANALGEVSYNHHDVFVLFLGIL